MPEIVKEKPVLVDSVSTSNVNISSINSDKPKLNDVENTSEKPRIVQVDMSNEWGNTD